MQRRGNPMSQALQKMLALCALVGLCLPLWQCATVESPRDVDLMKTTPQFSWGKGFGGKGDDLILQVVADQSGHIFVLGTFQEELALDQHTLQTQPSITTFIAKANSEGEWLWAKYLPRETIKAIKVNSFGHLIIAGSYFGTIAIGSTTLSTDDNGGLFVASLTPDGQWEWAKSIFSGVRVLYSAISIDQNDQIYLASCVSGFGIQATTQPPSDPPRGLSNGVLFTKLSATGERLWLKKLDSHNPYAVRHNIQSVEGGAVVVFTVREDTTIATTSFETKGQSVHVVAKLSDTGEWLWAKRLYATEQPMEQQLVAHDNGELSVLAPYIGQVDLMGQTFKKPDKKRGNLFVRLKKDGSLGWIKEIDDTSARSEDKGLEPGGLALIHSITPGPQGSLLITGSFYGKILLGSISMGALQSPLMPKSNRLLMTKLSASGTWEWGTTTPAPAGDVIGLSLLPISPIKAMLVGTFDYLYPWIEVGTQWTRGVGKRDIFLSQLHFPEADKSEQRESSHKAK